MVISYMHTNSKGERGDAAYAAGRCAEPVDRAIEIHRFLHNPWIPAQSMDPQIAQRDPWIAQIHRLCPTIPLSQIIRHNKRHKYNSCREYFVCEQIVLFLLSSSLVRHVSSCWKRWDACLTNLKNVRHESWLMTSDMSHQAEKGDRNTSNMERILISKCLLVITTITMVPSLTEKLFRNAPPPPPPPTGSPLQQGIVEGCKFINTSSSSIGMTMAYWDSIWHQWAVPWSHSFDLDVKHVTL